MTKIKEHSSHFKGNLLLRKGLICWFVLLPGFLPGKIAGQTVLSDTAIAIVDSQQFEATFFDTDDLMKIVLRFDITYYKKKKPTEEYLDALLTYYIGETDSINKNIKLRARGNFRRTFCDFPPLLLNFWVSDTLGGEFRGIDKMKLVPHCKPAFEAIILREYLAYKLYNILTESSLRVRLLEIEYIDTHKKSKPIKEYGFAIEPYEHFDKRTHSREVNMTNLTQKHIRPDVMDRVAIFNYMIGNTDWSVPNQHNVQIFSQFSTKETSLGILVPYDFDHSGLVNAYYAYPFKDLPIETVRDRLYLGICREMEAYQDAIREFADKKEAFYKVIRDFEYLPERSKKDMINFLNGFYGKFDRWDTIVSDMLKTCKDF
ncbi:MAG: hypothetical protein JW830_15440 [Bacteroidales bacterium]|nr:hypothetical protein [Bacteroidales bacterium]